MKMLFKQRFFSFFDSYDVYAVDGTVLYRVEGQLSWGHRVEIHDGFGRILGEVKQQVFTLLPKFEIISGGRSRGYIRKEFSFLHPRYYFDCNGWQAEGGIMEWDYSIVDAHGNTVARITKELFNWTDTYVIEVADPQNALEALMFVLAIDAEKCSRNNH